MDAHRESYSAGAIRLRFSLSDAQSRGAVVELTALLDVTFMLVIFLVITTRFVDDRWLDVLLPTAAGEQQATVAENLEILVDRHGRIFVGDGEDFVDSSVSGMEELMLTLSEVAGRDRSQQVRIRADGRTQYKAIVTVMDAMTRLGFENISLAVDDSGNL